MAVDPNADITEPQLQDAVQRMKERMASIGLNPGTTDEEFQAAAGKIFNQISAISGQDLSQLEWNAESPQALGAGIDAFLKSETAQLLQDVIDGNTDAFPLTKDILKNGVIQSIIRSNQDDPAMRVRLVLDVAGFLPGEDSKMAEKLDPAIKANIPAVFGLFKDHQAVLADFDVLARNGLVPGITVANPVQLAAASQPTAAPAPAAAEKPAESGEPTTVDAAIQGAQDGLAQVAAATGEAVSEAAPGVAEAARGAGNATADVIEELGENVAPETSAAIAGAARKTGEIVADAATAAGQSAADTPAPKSTAGQATGQAAESAAAPPTAEELIAQGKLPVMKRQLAEPILEGTIAYLRAKITEMGGSIPDLGFSIEDINIPAPNPGGGLDADEMKTIYMAVTGLKFGLGIQPANGVFDESVRDQMKAAIDHKGSEKIVEMLGGKAQAYTLLSALDTVSREPDGPYKPEEAKKTNLLTVGLMAARGALGDQQVDGFIGAVAGFIQDLPPWAGQILNFFFNFAFGFGLDDLLGQSKTQDHSITASKVSIDHENLLEQAEKIYQQALDDPNVQGDPEKLKAYVFDKTSNFFEAEVRKMFGDSAVGNKVFTTVKGYVDKRLKGAIDEAVDKVGDDPKAFAQQAQQMFYEALGKTPPAPAAKPEPEPGDLTNEVNDAAAGGTGANGKGFAANAQDATGAPVGAGTPGAAPKQPGPGAIPKPEEQPAVTP